MSSNQRHRHESSEARAGRLLATPGTPQAAGPRGWRLLGLSTGRDAVLCVPAKYKASRPLPFAVLLHGAGGSIQRGAALLHIIANITGIIILAPESRGPTWDLVRGGYGPDVAFLDQALRQVFQAYAIDPTRLAIGGFSDGASYALSLGLTNGDLFSHVLAFAPGFMSPAQLRGQPRIFLTHGTRDKVLPIDRCSRRLLPQLTANYDVHYREFDGGHIIPPRLVREAARWFTRWSEKAQLRL
jgi:phospholipase/carboxylesterase